MMSEPIPPAGLTEEGRAACSKGEAASKMLELLMIASLVEKIEEVDVKVDRINSAK